jgi:predicted membrane protein
MRKHFSNVLLGIILVVIGLLILLDNLGTLDFWPTLWKLWPLILIVLGIWLVWKKSSPFSVEVSSTSGVKKYNQAFGDFKIAPNEITKEGVEISLGFGNAEVNLSQTHLQDGENKAYINVGFGEIKVLVPQGIPGSVKGNSFLGKIEIFDKHAGGISNVLEHRDDGYELAQKKVKIIGNVGFGGMRITRT